MARKFKDRIRDGENLNQNIGVGKKGKGYISHFPST